MKQALSETTFPQRHQTVVKFAPRQPKPAVKKPKPNLVARFGLKRTSWRDLTLARVLKGGRVSDLGRFGRYAMIVTAGLCLAWGPAIAYLKFASPAYTSHFSLILPGAGAVSSISVSDIGQASSSSSSAFSGSSISPTVTYKNLLMSANVINAAAVLLKVDPNTLPIPTIKLVDETSFISVEIDGANAEQARNRANAILDAFFAELNNLRDDETKRRFASVFSTVKQHEDVVNGIREKISRLQISSGLSSTEQFNRYVTENDGLKIRVADLEALLSKTKHSKISLANNLNMTDALAATTMKLHADPEFAALADATSKAEAVLASTAQQYGAKHPKVVDARAQFQGARTQMLARASQITGLSVKKLVGKIDLSPTGQRSALMSQLVGLSTDQRGLEGQLQTMKAELEIGRKKIESLIDTASTLDRLNSEHKVAEAVFSSALARISTTKTDIFASYPMAQVSEAAIMPLTPSSPNKKIAFGAATGSSVLLLLVLLMAWVRRPLIDKLLNLAHKPNVETQLT